MLRDYFNEGCFWGISEMNSKKDNYEIDAMHIISLLLKRWWVISLFVLAFAAAGFGYTKMFVKPQYKSEATLLINGESSISSAYQQILAGQYQSKDYPHILNSNDTLSEVADILNSYEFSENGGKPYREYNAGVVRSMIKCEAVEDSRIFRISASSSNPEEARLVAEVVAKVFIGRAETLTESDIGVVDNPVLPTSPASMGYSKNVLIGFALGLILGVAYAIVAGIVNDSIDSEEWLLDNYENEIPLLAVVPDASTESKGYYRYNSKYGKNTDIIMN